MEMSELYLHKDIIDKKNRKYKNIFFLFFGLIIFSYISTRIFFNITKAPNNDTAFLIPVWNPVAAVVKEVAQIIAPINTFMISDLGFNVSDYGIFIKNLKTGATFTNYQNKKFL